MREKSEYKIEKGLPIPASDRRGRPYHYPWRDMAVGDSTLIRGANNDNAACRKKASCVRTSISRFGKTHNQKFRALMTSAGLRVWRTK